MGWDIGNWGNRRNVAKEGLRGEAERKQWGAMKEGSVTLRKEFVG